MAIHDTNAATRSTMAERCRDAAPDMADPVDEVPLLVMTRVVRYRTTNRELRHRTRRDR